MNATESVINDLNVAKIILLNTQMLTPEMCLRIGKTITSAIDLLKEQEPRVLTCEEAKKAEVCWLEQRGYEPFATLEADTWNPEMYGKNYRCWNRMPTYEQRKAAKWK